MPEPNDDKQERFLAACRRVATNVEHMVDTGTWTSEMGILYYMDKVKELRRDYGLPPPLEEE
jgi:hypothetical protein